MVLYCKYINDSENNGIDSAGYYLERKYIQGAGHEDDVEDGFQYLEAGEVGVVFSGVVHYEESKHPYVHYNEGGFVLEVPIQVVEIKVQDIY